MKKNFLYVLCGLFAFFSPFLCGENSSKEESLNVLAKYPIAGISYYEITEDFFIQKSRFTGREVRRIRLEDIMYVKKKTGFALGLEISRFLGVLTLLSALYFLLLEEDVKYDGSFKANMVVGTPFLGIFALFGWSLSFSCYCLSLEMMNGEEIEYRFYFSVDEIDFMDFIKRANQQIFIRKQKNKIDALNKQVEIEADSLHVIERYLIFETLCYELTDEFFIDKTGLNGTELKRIKLEDIKSVKKKRVTYPALITCVVCFLIALLASCCYRLIKTKRSAWKHIPSALGAIAFCLPVLGIVLSVLLYFASYRVSLEMMNGERIVLSSILTDEERLEEFIKLLNQHIDLRKKQKEIRAHPQQVEAVDKKQKDELERLRKEMKLLKKQE